MIGLAPDHHADGHEAVVLAALGRQCDGARNLERPGHREHFGLVACFLQRGTRAFDQLVVQVGVEARFHDQEFGH